MARAARISWSTRSGALSALSGARSVDAHTALAVALSGLLFVAFFAVPYLPMVDLPQHAAQIRAWLSLSDPALPEAREYFLNLRTPYLTAYLLSRGLAPWVGVVPALKLVTWSAVVAHFWAFSLLVRSTGHPRWLGLLGLPLGLGYPFFFGFVSFVFALPLVLLCICAALVHREGPSVRRGFALGAALSLTLLTHGFALWIAFLFVGPLLLRGRGSLALRWFPLLMPALLFAVWLLPGTPVPNIGATVWDPRFFELFTAPALLFAASGTDHAALVLGYGALALIVFASGAPSRALERWIPLGLVVAGFCLFPRMLNGFGPWHPRFACFLPAALLLALEPRPVPRPWRLPELELAFSMIWFLLFAYRLAGFARETSPIARFIARMPDGLSVRPIVFDRESSAFPGLPALLHLSAYYQAEKGGFQGYSFAMYPTSIVRYAPGTPPGMGGGAEWHPEGFAIEAELPRYDCFLVRSAADRSRELFGDRQGELDVAFDEGGWRAYRVRRALVQSTGGHS